MWVAPATMVDLLKWWNGCKLKPNWKIIWDVIAFAVGSDKMAKKEWELVFEDKTTEWGEVLARGEKDYSLDDFVYWPPSILGGP